MEQRLSEQLTCSGVGVDLQETATLQISASISVVVPPIPPNLVTTEKNNQLNATLFQTHNKSKTGITVLDFVHHFAAVPREKND